MRNFLVFWRGRMFLGGKKFNTEPVAQIHESTFLVTGAQPDFFSSLRGLAKMEKKCDLWEASLRISLPFPWPSPACQLTLVRPAQLAWLLRREIQSKRWLSGIKGRVRHHPTQYPPWPQGVAQLPLPIGQTRFLIIRNVWLRAFSSGSLQCSS